MSIEYGLSINHEYQLSVSIDTAAFSTQDPSFVCGPRKYPHLPKESLNSSWMRGGWGSGECKSSSVYRTF